MYFHSFSDFLAMGHHGVYVWSAYGISAVVIIANMVLAVKQAATLRKTLARQARREQQLGSDNESGT